MIDPTIITKLAAAGAMGVSIYCVLKVYELLKKEQEKEQPRSAFIRSIYVSMGFAVVMTLLSLGIEFVRFDMDRGVDNLKTDLQALEAKNLYSLDSAMNPRKLTISYEGETIVLCSCLPKNLFKENELKIEKALDGKFKVYKKQNENEIILGYVSDSQLDRVVESEEPAFNVEELWPLGWLYSPRSVLTTVDYSASKDAPRAIDYLTTLLQVDDSKLRSQQLNAIRILTQPSSMINLKEEHYEVLISALESDIRSSPWDEYELSQVYRSRSIQSWNDHKEEDRNESIECQKSFVKSFEFYNWDQDTTNHIIEYQWYKACKQAIAAN